MTNFDSQFIRAGRTGFLLIHGLGGTPMELRYVAQRLAKEGHTVYCPLLDGHSGGVFGFLQEDHPGGVATERQGREGIDEIKRICLHDITRNQKRIRQYQR